MLVVTPVQTLENIRPEIICSLKLLKLNVTQTTTTWKSMKKILTNYWLEYSDISVSGSQHRPYYFCF